MFAALACAVLLQTGPDTAGKLFAVGGGRTPRTCVEKFIEASGGNRAVILVLPLMREDPKASGPDTVAFVKEFGPAEVLLFDDPKPDAQALERLEAMLNRASGVWLSGGQQVRFVQRLGKPWIDTHLRPFVARGGNAYGTSAGAMLFSDPMIEGPGTGSGTSQMGPGIGWTNWVIDSHFHERRRSPRLAHALKQVGRVKGLGLGEGEWAVIQNDRLLEVHGRPAVWQRRTSEMATFSAYEPDRARSSTPDAPHHRTGFR